MLKIVLGILMVFEFAVTREQDSLTPQVTVADYSVLSESQVVAIQPDFTYTHTVERKLIVKSNEGLDHAFTRLFYDKLNEVESFDIEVTDVLSGKLLKKGRLKDMIDAAYYSSSTVFDDSRYKYYEVSAAKFPVEVKIKSQVSSKTNFFLPRWSPVRNYNQKVSESTFSVSYPTSIGLKYKEVNLTGSKKQTEAAGITTITWTELDLPVQARGSDWDEDPKLLLAPVKFSLDQYSGEMDSWSGLAAWQSELNKGRDVLPADFKEKVLALVDGVDEPYEKVKILYSYLQRNFRYVSIQLGIGGWQTMTAADVVKYSYGDCKGLTNLMKAMLDVAGIPSNYTLVFAGENADDIEVDLPSIQFNHVILQVPTDNQPIWLECTSTLLPAGYLGDFTAGRHVLVTDSNGGHLTKTPSYDAGHWNEILSQSKVVLDLQGNARIETKQQFSGNFAADLLYVKANLDERRQRDYFNRNSAVAGLIVGDYQIDVVSRDSLPVTELAFDGMLQKFAQATAKRIVLRPFLGKLGPEHLANKGLKQVDEYDIELPDSWQPDGNFPQVSMDEAHIKAMLEMKLEGKYLRVRREINLTIPDDFEKADQTELLRKVNVAFERTVLFKNATVVTSSASNND